MEDSTEARKSWATICIGQVQALQLARDRTVQSLRDYLKRVRNQAQEYSGVLATDVHDIQRGGYTYHEAAGSFCNRSIEHLLPLPDLHSVVVAVSDQYIRVCTCTHNEPWPKVHSGDAIVASVGHFRRGPDSPQQFAKPPYSSLGMIWVDETLTPSQRVQLCDDLAQSWEGLGFQASRAVPDGDTASKRVMTVQWPATQRSETFLVPERWSGMDILCIRVPPTSGTTVQ